VGHLVLKGKNEALMVYEPLVGEGGEALQRDIAYEAAYDLLQRQDPGAREAFERLAQERPQDPLVRLHLQRLHAGEHGDTIVLDEK
jgi:adenylate cyclase